MDISIYKCKKGHEFGMFPRFWKAAKIQSFSDDLVNSEYVLSDSFLHWNENSMNVNEI